MVKRVVRSAFADGGPDSLREFPEVFPNETKELKVQTGRKRKRGVVEQRFGDYDDDEAESGFESSELADQTEESLQDDGDDSMPSIDRWLGGTESILLRQRVITLVSTFTLIKDHAHHFSFRVWQPISPIVSKTAKKCTMSSPVV
jgi:hypothetical protein